MFVEQMGSLIASYEVVLAKKREPKEEKRKGGQKRGIKMNYSCGCFVLLQNGVYVCLKHRPQMLACCLRLVEKKSRLKPTRFNSQTGTLTF